MHVSELVRAIHGMTQNAGKRPNSSVQDLRTLYV